MCRKLLELAGSFSGFSIAIILGCLLNFGMLLVIKQVLNMSSSHGRATGPKCLSCSLRLSSNPAMFCFITPT